MSDAIDEVMAGLRREYLLDAPARLAELRKDLLALRAGEADAAQSLSGRFHRLSGSGGSHGYPEISEIAKGAENFLRQSPLPAPGIAADHLSELVDRLATSFVTAGREIGLPLGAGGGMELILERLGQDAPLTYVDSPFAVQFYLNRVHPAVSFERAAALLRKLPAAWVVVSDYAQLQKVVGTNVTPWHEVLRWPETGEPSIRIVGNQPIPISTQPVAMLLGPLHIEAQSLHLERHRTNYRAGTELNFRGNATQGTLRIENQGDSRQSARIRIFDENTAIAPTENATSLAPGETWSWPKHPQTMK